MFCISRRTGRYSPVAAGFFVPVRLPGQALRCLLSLNPNRSLDRPMGIGLSFSDFPIAFVPLSASCLPLCLGVARYAFGKGGGQSARRQNEIALDSNDRFGLKRGTGRLCPTGAGLPPVQALSPQKIEPFRHAKKPRASASSTVQGSEASKPKAPPVSSGLPARCSSSMGLPIVMPLTP